MRWCKTQQLPDSRSEYDFKYGTCLFGWYSMQDDLKLPLYDYDCKPIYYQTIFIIKIVWYILTF
jgi:hypothetical protein